jgi:hypothetical protein
MNQMTLTEMLESNSIPEPNSGCWLWLRGCSNDYPVAWWEGRQQYAHRLALKAKGVDLADRDEACHRCDNTFCVNEDHLFPGDHSINALDASAKGRLVRRRSCDHPLTVYAYGKRRRCLICQREKDRLRYKARRDG